MPTVSESLDQWRRDFPRPGPSARQALAAIAALYATAREDPWGQAAFPEWSTKSPWRLGLLLESGLGQALNWPGREAGLAKLRIQALENNAALAVHQALDGAGVPHLAQEEASRQGARAIDASRPHALLALYASHPDFMTMASAGDRPIGLLKAVAAYLYRPSPAAVKVLEVMARHGANWDHPQVGKVVANAPPENKGKWEVLLPALKRHAMEHRLPDSTSPRAPAPRM